MNSMCSVNATVALIMVRCYESLTRVLNANSRHSLTQYYQYHSTNLPTMFYYVQAKSNSKFSCFRSCLTVPSWQCTFAVISPCTSHNFMLPVGDLINLQAKCPGSPSRAGSRLHEHI